jgi:predicted nucleic acid-binding Zn ribbon protein
MNCEICGGTSEGDICSDKCGEIWIKKYIDEGLN